MNIKQEVELIFHECLTEHGEVEIASAPDDLEGLIVDVFDDQHSKQRRRTCIYRTEAGAYRRHTGSAV